MFAAFRQRITVRTLLYVIVLLTAFGCGEATVESGWTGSPLEFRIAHSTPQVGFWAVEFEGADLYLTPWTMLTAGDVESLGLERQGGKVVLTAILYSGRSDHLAEVTGRNVGNHLAVLVDGEVRALSRIESPIGGGTRPLQVSFDMNKREADTFAKAVRARQLVRPSNGRAP